LKQRSFISQKLRPIFSPGTGLQLVALVDYENGTKVVAVSDQLKFAECKDDVSLKLGDLHEAVDEIRVGEQHVSGELEKLNKRFADRANVVVVIRANLVSIHFVCGLGAAKKCLDEDGT